MSFRAKREIFLSLLSEDFSSRIHGIRNDRSLLRQYLRGRASARILIVVHTYLYKEKFRELIMAYDDNLFKNIEQLSDEQLLDMLGAPAGSYTEDALNIAKQIAEKRGGVNFLRSKIAKLNDEKYNYFKELSDEALIEAIDIKHKEYSEEELNIMKEIAEKRGGVEILRLKTKPDNDSKGSAVSTSKRGASLILGVLSLILGIGLSGEFKFISGGYGGSGLDPRAGNSLPSLFLIITGISLILSSLLPRLKKNK